MPEWLDIASIIALLGTIGGWIGLAIQSRKNKSDAKILVDKYKTEAEILAEKNKNEAAATIHAAYNSLCVELRGRITQLHADIDRAVERISQLEQQNVELRQENETLKDKVCDLEDLLASGEKERVRLTKEVDELSERLAKYETRPTRTSRARTTR